MNKLAWLGKKLKREEGQALPLALITLALGSLLIGSFLNSASTNLLASKVFWEKLPARYAADAAIEDAIWNLRYGDLVSLTEPEDSVSYSLSEPVNGFTPRVTVTRVEPIPNLTLATDDFESNSWSGGSGWLGSWYHEGDALITKSGSPYEGEYHLQLRRDSGYVKRGVDLLGESNVYLILRAKAKSFKKDDTAECLVSSGSENWTTLRTWVDGEDDDTYHYYQFNLSSYATEGQLWIAFAAHMPGKGAKFYVDDLRVVVINRPIDYEIVTTVGEVTIRAGVAISGEARPVVSWVIE